MERTSQTVSCLGAEHRNDPGTGSVSLSATVLKNVLDLVQVSALVAKEPTVLRLFPPLKGVFAVHLLGVYV